MFRNYLVAALRNLVRNKLYSAINIIGLALGLTAALLIALFVRDEFSYDTWIPEHAQVYAVYMRYVTDDKQPTEWSTSVIDMAALLKLDFPEIEEATRLRINPNASLRHGELDVIETVYWADANFFRVLPVPVIAGDLSSALDAPDSVVLTRSKARKYFGKDAPIGETLELYHKYPLRVTAVIEDLPSNSHLNTDIIISGRASFSLITLMDARPGRGPDQPVNVKAVYTYVKLKAGASIDTVRAATPGFIARRLKDAFTTGLGRREEPVFVPLAKVHLTRFGSNPITPPGDLGAIKALAIVGTVIIALAAINFVNLMTARAGRRAVEVGVRKVSGAERRHLVVQFLGEAATYIGLAMILALGLAVMLLPAANAFLQRSIAVDALHSGRLIAVLIAGVIGLAAAAGFYPAFVLSAFRPASVIRGGLWREQSWAGRVRQILVAVQFAILIGLVAVAGIVFRQTNYAQNEGLRLDKDQVILIQTACRSAFKDDVAKLPGVQAVACSGLAPLNHQGFSQAMLADGRETDVALDPVDFGFFELYGLQPRAGRFFQRDRGKDAVVLGQTDWQPNIVINESAVTKLGFAAPEDAVGKTISFKRFDAATGKITNPRPTEIVGVVEDFPIGSVQERVLPTLFFVDPASFGMAQVKLNGNALPETLKNVEKLWAEYSDNFPLSFTFFDQKVQALYLDITRQGRLLAVFSAVAVFIAGLGLLGLSAFTAENRTKEIGIRKAMGASHGDVLRLLLWQFAKPVLWANVIAWPVGYAVMKRWLEGFAYHIAIEPWIFLGASALALLIAIATIFGHALLVARARPVSALRHE